MVLITAALNIGLVYADGLPKDNITFRGVVDGDTVAVDIKEMPAKFRTNIKIRIYGVDTPESKAYLAGCAEEVAMGLKAKEFVKHKLENAKTVDYVLQKNDKYAGRILGDVIIDGKPLSTMLINGGYARAYFGDKKKSWCN